MKSQELRKLLERRGLHPDQVRTRDGAFEVRRTYFYRHGRSAEDWAEQVAQSLPAPLKVVGSRDDYAAWPRDSYFTAVVKEVP